MAQRDHYKSFLDEARERDTGRYEVRVRGGALDEGLERALACFANHETRGWSKHSTPHVDVYVAGKLALTVDSAAQGEAYLAARRASTEPRAKWRRATDVPADAWENVPPPAPKDRLKCVECGRRLKVECFIRGEKRPTWYYCGYGIRPVSKAPYFCTLACALKYACAAAQKRGKA